MTNTPTSSADQQRISLEHQPRPGSPDAHPRLFVLLALVLGMLAAVGFRLML